ncbi:hypothetical protein QEN19_003228 [Hanseniaspora menglaensis]
MQNIIINKLQTITDIIKLVNSLACFFLAVFSLVLIKRNNVVKYHVPLGIITVASITICVINLVEIILAFPRIKQEFHRLNISLKIKNVFLLTFNFLILGSSIAFINNILIANLFSEKDTKLIVAHLVFLLLQQLTFFSIILNYEQKCKDDLISLTDPEAFLMKPMRIPSKQIQYKSSEQTLTSNMDWIQQHELQNLSNNSVNKYDLSSYENNMSLEKVAKNGKWKRAFGKLVQIKKLDPHLENNKSYKKKDKLKNMNISQNSFNQEQPTGLNIAPSVTHYYNDTQSINSQRDISHDVTIMLENNNTYHPGNKHKSHNGLDGFSDSFEIELNAEQIALSKINNRLLPPRLTTKQSYTKMEYKNESAPESRIPSDELESSVHTLSKVPVKFYNDVSLINNHDNVASNIALNNNFKLEDCVDTIDFLDNFFALNRKNQHHQNPSFDMSTSYEVDKEIIHSALSDNMSKRSIVNSANEHNYNTLNSRHSPSKSISSLMMGKHKKAKSLTSNFLTTSPKKTSFSNPPKHSHSKTLSTKLSLSNISFNVNEHGKIDFASQKFLDFDTHSSHEKDNKKEMLWEENLRLEDIEETRKISEKSFDYPTGLVSQYDKEKWKLISDYS